MGWVISFSTLKKWLTLGQGTLKILACNHWNITNMPLILLLFCPIYLKLLSNFGDAVYVHS